MQIDTISIIGLGALGTMYADFLTRAMPPASIRVIADEARRTRYEQAGLTCNGRPCTFDYVDPATTGDPADLVIFAVKYPALAQAMDDAANQIGPDTAILSVMNGIASEEELAQRFGVEKVLLAVAQEMDAVHEGATTTYTRFGRLALGMPTVDDEATSQALSDRLDAVEDLFYDVELPFFEPADIRKQLWSKLMCNVGINQACMVFNCDYGGVQRGGMARDNMLGAMRETAAVARAEGIDLTEKDIDGWKHVLDTLSPEGKPSMKQDADAHRPSEVELFGGTVCRLGRAHGIPTPVNDAFVKRITEMESRY